LSEAADPAASPAPAGLVRDRALRSLSVAHLRTLAILVGGTAGALGRAGVDEALPTSPGHWPWATLIVNLVGTMFLAWLTTALAERVAPTHFWRPLLGTGFCGAFTTFSSFQIEAIRLGKDGHVGIAVGYAASSLALGMACAVAGTMTARRRRYR
jgi:CrcB protein